MKKRVLQFALVGLFAATTTFGQVQIYSSQSIASTDSVIKAFVSGGSLIIDSKPAETIDVYTLTGNIASDSSEAIGGMDADHAVGVVFG